MRKRTNKNKNNHQAFTIVELLVVIVVIGILATITIVSYTGITSRANETAIKSELSNASTKLNLYYATYSSYPTTTGLSSSTNWCPTLPTEDNEYCLKFSAGTGLVYEAVDLSNPSTYTLTATKNNLTYRVTNNLAPYAVITIPITSISSITGTPQVSQTLTAGTITPSDATVSYQWQSSTTSDGTYENIVGATSSTYTLTSNEVAKYIKVVVTGIGNYTNTQTSTASSQVKVGGDDWLTIGTQTWAKKNLNVGTMITGTTNQTNNSNLEKYCYNNDETNCTTYGALYQWDEAMQYTNTEGAQGICPTGSHIPSDNEIKILEIQLGMTQAQANLSSTWRGTDQGTKLKLNGTSGLNVPLSGSRYDNGTFVDLSSGAYLWSSSESSSSVWIRLLSASQSNVYRSAYSKMNVFSVRCLGD